MKFEIVEAYEIRIKNKPKPLGWSIQIYLPELDMDIRGFTLIHRNSGWVLQMPYMHNYDLEEKKGVRYPVISFLDRGKTEGWAEEIKIKAIAYVQEKIAQEMAEKDKEFKEKKKKDKKVNEKF